jgi:hypothetical protein
LLSFFFYHQRCVNFNLAAMTLMQGHRDQCNVTLHSRERFLAQEEESLWGEDNKKRGFHGSQM